MSISESDKSKDATLTRDILTAFRYHVGTRRVILVLGAAALVGGLALNWNWLVAIGAAPILLSTLPCLVMCGFGVCMMCRSNKTQTTALSGVADSATSPTMLGITKIDPPTAGDSSCCEGADRPKVSQ